MAKWKTTINVDEGVEEYLKGKTNISEFINSLVTDHMISENPDPHVKSNNKKRKLIMDQVNELLKEVL